jgi:hypothetical protein
MYFTKSCKEAGRGGIQFKIDDLDFIINGIEIVIESTREAQSDDVNPHLTLEKDKSFSWVSVHHLDEITNGEYYWELYKILLDMLSDEPSKINLTQRVIFYQAVEDACDAFLDALSVAEAVDYDKQDLLRIYNRIQKCNGEGAWANEGGEEITSEQLSEYLSEEHWKTLTEKLLDELFPEREKYKYLTNFSQTDWQPHLPNLQEYRKALCWINEQFGNTRGNNLEK